MTNQIIMDNYLMLLKSTVEVYVHGTLESSNEKIRRILNNSLNTTLKCQAATYDLMTKYNWYNVKNIKSSEIKTVLKSLK